jgi:hypothetical protein
LTRAPDSGPAPSNRKATDNPEVIEEMKFCFSPISHSDLGALGVLAVHSELAAKSKAEPKGAIRSFGSPAFSVV